MPDRVALPLAFLSPQANDEGLVGHFHCLLQPISQPTTAPPPASIQRKRAESVPARTASAPPTGFKESGRAHRGRSLRQPEYPLLRSPWESRFVRLGMLAPGFLTPVMASPVPCPFRKLVQAASRWRPASVIPGAAMLSGGRGPGKVVLLIAPTGGNRQLARRIPAEPRGTGRRRPQRGPPHIVCELPAEGFGHAISPAT